MSRAAVVIDGSVLEGGGQILRNSVAYSCLTSQPLHVHKIRANRKEGGLKAQHLTGIQLVTAVCGGELKGGTLGSSTIELDPKNIRSGRFVADTRTAGSVTLLMQAVLPCLFFTPGVSEGVFRGGTNASMAPQIDYTIRVFQPILEKFAGTKFGLTVPRRGYYPRGGGEVRVTVNPVESIQPITMVERGEIVSVSIRSFVAGTVPQHVCERMALSARQTLRKVLNPKLFKDDELVRDTPANGDGVGIMIVAETSTGCLLAGSALGERRKAAEAIGKEAANELLKHLEEGGCVDEYLQDQLIIYMALAKGSSSMLTGPISLHTQTAIFIAEQMTSAKFTVKPVSGQNLITCEGMGLTNPHYQEFLKGGPPKEPTLVVEVAAPQQFAASNKRAPNPKQKEKQNDKRHQRSQGEPSSVRKGQAHGDEEGEEEEEEEEENGE